MPWPSRAACYTHEQKTTTSPAIHRRPGLRCGDHHQWRGHALRPVACRVCHPVAGAYGHRQHVPAVAEPAVQWSECIEQARRERMVGHIEGGLVANDSFMTYLPAPAAAGGFLARAVRRRHDQRRLGHHPVTDTEFQGEFVDSYDAKSTFADGNLLLNAALPQIGSPTISPIFFSGTGCEMTPFRTHHPGCRHRLLQRRRCKASACRGGDLQSMRSSAIRHWPIRCWWIFRKLGGLRAWAGDIGGIVYQRISAACERGGSTSMQDTTPTPAAAWSGHSIQRSHFSSTRASPSVRSTRSGASSCGKEPDQPHLCAGLVQSGAAGAHGGRVPARRARMV